MKSVMKTMALLFSLVALEGCDNESSYYTDTPVIEAYLHSGSYFSLTIRRQTSFLSDMNYSEDDVNNLNVQVSVDNELHTLTPLGDGKYIDSSIVVTDGKQYDLTFHFNSKDVSAYTIVPTKPVGVTQSVTEMYRERVDLSSGPPTPGSMPDPIELTWNNPDASYYLILVENVEETLDPIIDLGGDLPAPFFRRPPINSSNGRISATQFRYFGRHRIVLFHLLPDYADLFNDNSTSSQNLTNPSTSIINGYGIFTGLSSDTLWVDIIEQQ
jgi:hypothetical protein